MTDTRLMNDAPVDTSLPDASVDAAVPDGSPSQNPDAFVAAPDTGKGDRSPLDSALWDFGPPCDLPLIARDTPAATPDLGRDLESADLETVDVPGDLTPPVLIRINDGTGADIDTQKSVNVLAANWAFEDLESGIARYEWAIGTSSGAIDTMGWTDVKESMTASHTGLYVSGKTYFVSVRATNGAGLSTIATSDGISVDASPFMVRSVNDGVGSDVDIQLSASTLSANWAIEDPASGIAGYEWAIGTAVGGQDIKPFVSVGTGTHADATGLSLPVDGTTLYVTVRATSLSGATLLVSSDGVKVGCAIAGVLVPGASPDPKNPCLACLPGIRSDSYSARPGGTTPCPRDACGMIPDGCGGMKTCGECQAPKTCGGGGVPHVCGCIPLTCAGTVQRCGTISDGCGGTLNCDACTAPNHCGPLGTCGVADNVVVYSNYSGGSFTINVDQDIPNLAIGIVSYDAPTVTIAGPFASNVVAVAHAGAKGAPGNSITVDGPAKVTIETTPKAPPPGPASIFCGYGGSPLGDGGCNSREQVRTFFTNKFQAPVLFQKCQYAAYTGTLNVSAGGTCTCEPYTCDSAGIACGDYPDGCGGTLHCGGCASSETCGGMGIPNVCGGCAPGQILTIPRHPSTVANDKSIGTLAWTIKNASTDFASISAMTGGASQYAKATGFGFALPANAVVSGIYAQWERKSLSAAGLMDNAVRIVKNDVVQSADRSDKEVWQRDYEVKTYGGGSDLWDIPWTAADINSAGFGAALSVKYVTGAGNDWPSLRDVALSVCYQ
jgi:hypothetical protein